MMQAIGQRYVACFNAGYRRTGMLWEGRFKSDLVDSESYVLARNRYIELNPVRARMTRSAEGSPWSSYRHNALGTVDPDLSSTQPTHSWQPATRSVVRHTEHS